MPRALDDPQIAVAAAYCCPRGIPVSWFLGGPNEWDALSRQVALEWLVQDRETCRNCGTRQAEWDEDRGGHRDAYYVDSDWCRGDELLNEARKALPADRQAATHLFLRPRQMREAP